MAFKGKLQKYKTDHIEPRRLTSLAIVGFILSSYATKWIAGMGYRNAFGSMAGIYVIVLVCGIPLYFWGRQIRNASVHWKIMHHLRWHEDRETGE